MPQGVHGRIVRLLLAPLRWLLAEGGEASPRRQAMRASLHRQLAAILARHGHPVIRALIEPDAGVLNAALGEGKQAWLEKLLDKEHEAILRALTADDARRLQALLRGDNHNALYRLLMDNQASLFQQLLARNKNKAAHHVLMDDDAAYLKHLLLESDAARLRKLLFPLGLMGEVVKQPLAGAWLEFERERARIAPWLPGDGAALSARFERQRERLKGPRDVPGRLTDALLEDGSLTLRGGTLHVTDAHALWTLLHELFINEDYHADLGTDTPRILDCGAHQGLSLFYFKQCYPGAAVVAFEPDPNNRAIAERNVRENGLAGVTILPYALAGQAGECTFHVPAGHSMAGSLTTRRREMGNATEEISVQTVRLSDYLGEPVDFLKLDVEGVEDEVLAEAAERLHQVHYLFCEYHHGLGLAPDRLSRILALLESRGFEVQVAKSYAHAQRTEHRPMDALGQPYSAAIYARNPGFRR